MRSRTKYPDQVCAVPFLLHLCVAVAVAGLPSPSNVPISSAALSPLLEDAHLLRRQSSSTPKRYIDPTLPPLLPDAPPLLSLPLLQHDFAYTYGSPPATSTFTVPQIPQFSIAVLEFSASCAGEQYDRIAAVWIDGIELLRTSTAEPTQSGVFWKVRKDVTRHSSLLRPNDLKIVTVMLENIVNDVYTGIYHVNVSLHLYAPQGSGGNEVGFRGKAPSYVRPADLILPISSSDPADGHWFRIRNSGERHASRRVRIPRNAYRAVLEIFVSFHGDDEFWYSNPPNSYIHRNHLPTSRGNASFREVFAEIDGLFAGSVVPFPVIFTGGINPLFWEPVVSIGAFNLPSYDLELTPFLGSLLDGGPHEIRLGLLDGIQFWLVDANLHLWLDPLSSSSVEAEVVEYDAAPFVVARSYEFDRLDGEFDIEAKRGTRFVGWVSSSLGNLTTSVVRELEFESSVVFKNDGNLKQVDTRSKSTTEVRVVEEDGLVLRASMYRKTGYPLRFVSEAISGKDSSSYRLETDLGHSLQDVSLTEVDGVTSMSNLSDRQSGKGWIDVEDHSVTEGSVSTEQSYYFSDNNGCWGRVVSVRDGEITEDETCSTCAPTM